MPKHDFSEIQTGFEDRNFSKNVCYNPTRIQSMNYGLGAHYYRPTGKRLYSHFYYPLLHYKCIGGAERVFKKHQDYLKRLPDHNNKSIAAHYRAEYDSFLIDFQNNIERAK